MSEDAGPGNQLMEYTLRRVRWMSAADRIFAVGVVDDGAYKDVVAAVGRVVAMLREQCRTVDDLMTLGPDALAATQEVLALAPTVVPMDAAVVLDAACGVLCAEIVFLTESSG